MKAGKVFLVLLVMFFLLAAAFVSATDLNAIDSNVRNTSTNTSIRVCTTEYNPVCGIKETSSCPSCTGTDCTECEPTVDYETYSNKCVLENAGATLVSNGKCLPCTPEGKTMIVYPGYRCCSGLSAISTTKLNSNGEYESLLGASICSKCGNGTCETWENKTNCLTDCPTNNNKDINTEVREKPCACTMEYAPVCGVNGKTYGNKCGARCESIQIAYEGECRNECSIDTDCKESVCLDGSLVQQTCNTGKCETNSKCVQAQSDFYRVAYWKCSNGKEFSQTSEKCLPYAEWKNIARLSCEKLTTKCETSIISTDVNNEIDTNLLDSNSTIDINLLNRILSSSSASSIRPIDTKCIGAERVILVDLQVKDQCEVGCKYSIDAQGCKVRDCGARGIDRSCPESSCKQSVDEIKVIKEKCYANNGQIIINYSDNCRKYICSTDTTTTTTQQCQKPEEVVPKAEEKCKLYGGTLLTKTNENGCLSLIECVGQTKDANSTETKPVNKLILSDTTKLLELALKLESLRMNLIGTAQKTKAIASYYTEQGRTIDAAKFERATVLLNQAIEKIDIIKKSIRDNASNFSEVQVNIVRDGIREIRESILKDVLMAILE